MDEHEYLTLKDLAKRCHLDLTIIREFEEFGLFPETESPEPDRYLPSEARHLEMLHRLHHDLDINLEGIEVMLRMRRQLEHLHREAEQLRRRIAVYEQLHFSRWQTYDRE